jgi:hypothetical protein
MVVHLYHAHPQDLEHGLEMPLEVAQTATQTETAMTPGYEYSLSVKGIAQETAEVIATHSSCPRRVQAVVLLRR